MQISSGKIEDIKPFKPAFNYALYKTEVNVIGKYLSGILIFKRMPDSSMRVVFSNEMGLTFFDFAFLPNGDFKIYSIVHQMNKKPVIKTLRKDFELILMQDQSPEKFSVNRKEDHIYYTFKLAKGNNYYITDSTRTELIRMENASKRIPIVLAVMKNYQNGIPDTIGISHTTFNFTIGLKRLQN